jgi:hypothetical protein
LRLQSNPLRCQFAEVQEDPELMPKLGQNLHPPDRRASFPLSFHNPNYIVLRYICEAINPYQRCTCASCCLSAAEGIVRLRISAACALQIPAAVG